MRNQKGFTLIELLIVITIFGIGIVTVVGMILLGRHLDATEAEKKEETSIEVKQEKQEVQEDVWKESKEW